MTKSKRNEKQINEAVALGRKNKELIPRVKNWCSHVKIEDVSAGMIAELYQLPITLRISCPHSSESFEAMNFEWNANDFIRDNCQKCKFHNEVFNPNFGREVLDNLQKIKRKEEKEIKEKKEIQQALKKHVDSLFSKKKSQSEITELSVLTLVQSLDSNKNKIKIASQLLEASKLSPEFFNSVALDYLSLYYDNKAIGQTVLRTTRNVLKVGQKLSQFGRERLYSTIDAKNNIDEISAIINCSLNDDIDYASVLEKIINALSYVRDIGESYEDRKSYPNTILLFENIYLKDPIFINEIIEKQLKIENKTTRININFFLQELIKRKAEIVKPFCIDIIKSLELEDDGYGESPDGVTCTTLSKLYIVYPAFVIDSIKKQFQDLTVGAKIELLFFYEILHRENYLKKDQYTPLIIEFLFELVLSKSNSIELKENVLSLIDRISSKNPLIVENYFDSIIGFFIDQYKALDTFKWYMKELKNSDGKISTFNPLIGKNYHEIDLDRMTIENTIRKSHSIIQNLIAQNTPLNCHITVLKIINNIESTKDGFLKSKLISLLNGSIKETIYLAEILPSLHGYLLDINSSDIRIEAIKFLKHIIEKHDQLITQTLIELVKTFLDDSDIAVKGQSIEAYGALIKMFPEKVERAQIDLILKNVLDPYIYVQKRAARLSYKVYPFLDQNQKIILLTGILSQEDYYFKKKEFDYCKELIDILLFISKEWADIYSNIVSKQVAKYCNTNDYYTDIDFLKKLTHIRSQNEGFNSIWIQQFIKFISRYAPDYNGFDKRQDMLDIIYQLPNEIILDQLTTIKELITNRIDHEKFIDVIPIFSILAYFGLYDTLYDLSNYINEKIENNKSNQSILKTNYLFYQISHFEKQITAGQIDSVFINSFLDNE